MRPHRNVESRAITQFPANHPEAMALGPDGNVWFGGGTKLGRITPLGDVATFDTMYGALIGAIAAGPDGRIWFTGDPGVIWAISVDGTGGTWMPPPTGHPDDIVAGPDGALWFTEETERQIGRVTPAWSFQEFSAEYEISSARAIATGSDGNLWFTTNWDTIGRMTPEGAASFFPVPMPENATQLGFTYGITAGPDGNIWFTVMSSVNDGSAIGRVTPTGVVTLFPLPDAACWPWEITAGPDGNLWFTERTTDFIGRITPAGEITEFATAPSGYGGKGIVAGADGRIWFAETDSNQIGALVP